MLDSFRVAVVAVAVLAGCTNSTTRTPVSTAEAVDTTLVAVDTTLVAVDTVGVGGPVLGGVLYARGLALENHGDSATIVRVTPTFRSASTEIAGVYITAKLDLLLEPFSEQGYDKSTLPAAVDHAALVNLIVVIRVPTSTSNEEPDVILDRVLIDYESDGKPSTIDANFRTWMSARDDVLHGPDCKIPPFQA
jgi:hypothetical protein